MAQQSRRYDIGRYVCEINIRIKTTILNNVLQHTKHSLKQPTFLKKRALNKTDGRIQGEGDHPCAI